MFNSRLIFVILITLVLVLIASCKEKTEQKPATDIKSFKPQVKIIEEKKNDNEVMSKWLNALTTFAAHLKLLLDNQDLKGLANICDFDQGLYIDEFKCTRDFIINSLEDGPVLNFPVWGISDFTENDPNLAKSKVKAKTFLWGPEGYFTKLAGTGLNQVYQKVIIAYDHPSLIEIWKKELPQIRKAKARWFVWDDSVVFRLVNCTNPDIVLSFSGDYKDLKLVEISTVYGIEP